MTARRRMMAVVALVVAATATLSGCEGRPGAAAVVDGTTITAADVDLVVSELQGYYTGVDRAGMLTILAEMGPIDDLAAELGNRASDDDVQAALDSAVQKAGGKKGHFSEVTREVIRFSIEWQSLQKRDDATEVKTRIDKLLAEQDIVVNPRFGTRTDGQTLVPTERTWIHVTTP